MKKDLNTHAPPATGESNDTGLEQAIQTAASTVDKKSGIEESIHDTNAGTAGLSAT